MLVIAGISLLAHSVIPHTHHNDHICIVNSPCDKQLGHSDVILETGEYKESSCDYSNSLDNPQDHQHGNHCHTDGCKLVEILVFDPAGNKSLSECGCYEGADFHPDLVQTVLPVSQEAVSMPWYNFPFLQKPYLLVSSGYDHSRIPGLRAPPVC